MDINCSSCMYADDCDLKNILNVCDNYNSEYYWGPNWEEKTCQVHKSSGCQECPDRDVCISKK